MSFTPRALMRCVPAGGGGGGGGPTLLSSDDFNRANGEAVAGSSFFTAQWASRQMYVVSNQLEQDGGFSSGTRGLLGNAGVSTYRLKCDGRLGFSTTSDTLLIVRSNTITANDPNGLFLLVRFYGDRIDLDSLDVNAGTITPVETVAATFPTDGTWFDMMVSVTPTQIIPYTNAGAVAATWANTTRGSSTYVGIGIGHVANDLDNFELWSS
jgi:hypothetical protein